MNDDEKKIMTLMIVGTVATVLSFLIDKIFLFFMNAIFFDQVARVFIILTLLGDIEWFIPLAIIVTMILVLKKRKIYAYWAAIICSAGLGFILKNILLRMRPFEYLGTPSIISTSLGSFPSGHALLVFTLLPFLLLNFPRYKIYFWTVALLIAFSRLYLGVHYLSDVVAGAFMGLIVSQVCIMIGERYGWC